MAVIRMNFAMRKANAEAGLTLVEMIIAIAILGFILLGIAPLFVASVKSNYSASEYTSINVIARDRLEQLMNLPFLDPQLTPGVKVNDLPPKLPDPVTGLPPASGGVANPFRITYQVIQYQVPAADVATVPNGAAFTPTRITVAGQPYQYKRVDVTVTAGTGPMGIGARSARVSGFLASPAPTAAAFASVADTCAVGAAAPCP
ncbi:MAG: type II secretion system GspH family protein [Acidobacteria bacterium]|nr:type II secretion system GspH family protein [Acidobacteriota bacterium]MCA1609886.1 type II secretion system GspH family protein [Acidobacteriota bacterium]